ncbi:hypothetical protein CRG98_049315, partial [Punica granatum]
MASWSPSSVPLVAVLLSLLLLQHCLCGCTVSAARIGRAVVLKPCPDDASVSIFHEAPVFNNGEGCGPSGGPGAIHVAMTLDGNYLRGTMAA